MNYIKILQQWNVPEIQSFKSIITSNSGPDKNSEDTEEDEVISPTIGKVFKATNMLST